MTIKMKLLEPFNGRMAGAVMECSIKLAANLEETGIGEESDDPVTDNPGASPDDKGQTSEEWANEVKGEQKRRGRPPKVVDE